MNLVVTEIIISTALVLLIWFVQILHYPSFHFHDKATFPESMKFHQNRISLIVVPLMICELILSLWFLSQDFSFNNLLTLIIIIFLWVYTFLVFVPLHKKLLIGKNDQLIIKLVKANWIRTVFWTIKFGIIFL